MKYQKVVNRPKGTIETFQEDASVISDNSGLAVNTMTASIVSGSSASIAAQSYANESLSFQINFSKLGQSVVKVVTDFGGSDETSVSIWLFRTTDDGSNSPFTDYA